MGFEPLRRILPKAIQSAGISRQVTAVRVIEEAMKLIQALWGEEKARYVECVSFAGGVLKIRALAPAAMQELKVWQIRLQNDLNRALGGKVISQIVFTDR